MAATAFIEVARAVRDAVRAELPKNVADALDARMGAFESRLAAAVAQVVRDQVLAQVTEAVGDLGTEFAAKLNAHATIVAELSAVVAALKTMPPPMVVVPENAIQIHVAQGNVSVPTDAIKVEVKQPDKLMLETTPRRTVVHKKIVYDQTHGRPIEIVETTDS